MAIDNPYELAQLLINDVNGRNKNIFMPSAPTTMYLDSEGNFLAENEWDLPLI